MTLLPIFPSLWLWLSVSFFGPAPLAAVRLPDVGQVAAAVRTGDDVEIERVAARLGAVRLVKIAQRGRREERLAALRALEVVEDGWAALVDLGRLLADRDGGVADAAARAARRIAEALGPDRAELDEVPRDLIERAAKELLARAADPGLSPAVRVSAISAATALRPLARIDESGFGRLLSDPEPQLRRAAAEALSGLGQSSTLTSLLEGMLEKDASAEVAAAAGGSLCRDVPATGDKGPAAGRVGRLTPAMRARLRALANDEQLALSDRLDLLPCLRVGATPEDRQLLDALSRRPPESLRRKARSLGGR
jgi:hypothetical protein